MTEHVAIAVPKQERELAESTPRSSTPTQADRKISNILEKLGGPLLAAAITSITVVIANAWIVPTVARHHRRIDRMYQAMFDAEQSARLLYGYTWNVWNERQKTAGATNKPLEDLQQTQAKAASLTLHLSLIFGDQMAADWERVVDGYHAVVYPITHAKEFPGVPTEEQMNERLNPLTQLAGESVRRMRDVILEVENRHWLGVLIGRR